MTERSDNEYSSWLESRRLIIAQLNTMAASIKDLGDKVDRFNEGARERSDDMSKEAREAVNQLNVRLSVLDMQVKTWAAVIGLGCGAGGTIAMQFILRGMGIK